MNAKKQCLQKTLHKTIICNAIALVSLTGCIAPESLEERSAEIHDRVLTIDAHIDWPIRQSLDPDFNPGIRNEPGGFERGQWDIIRMEEGGLDAVFMSIYTPQKERTEEGHQKAKELAIEQIETTYQLVEDYPEKLEIAITPDDAIRIERAGKRAIFMGMENGYPIGKDLSQVKFFFDLGIRYITLTHSKNNEIGDSSTDEKQDWEGLSPFGREVVSEMNRLGMIIDISHVHDDTFWDTIELTQAPIIASHSNVRALRDVPRNLSDDMLKAIQENGGVVQICFLGDYIKEVEQTPERKAAIEELQAERAALNRSELSQSEIVQLLEKYQAIDEKYPPNKPTLADTIDHIDYVVQAIGIDHVGIGSDFDGGGGVIDLEDVSQMPNITQELLARGYTEVEIRKLWGGNLMRVFRDAIRVSEELQRQ